MENPEKRKFSGEMGDSSTDGSDHQNKRATQDLQGPVISATMDCPNSKVAQVIGKKGATVKAIMEKSGCRVVLDPNPQQDPRKVYLTGSAASLAGAMQLVSQVIEEGPAFLVGLIPGATGVVSNPAASVVEDDLSCPHAKVSTLIGSKGVTINEIMKRTNVRIQVVQDGVPDGVDRKVSFTGEPSQIAQAKAMVRKILTEGLSSMGPGFATAPPSSSSYGPSSKYGGGGNSVERDIPPSRVGTVIGNKGTTIAEIMRLSGCRIVINQNFPEGHMHKVMYTGTPEQIHQGIQLVDSVLTNGPNILQAFAGAGAMMGGMPGMGGVVSQEMTMTMSEVTRVAGPQGYIFQDIQMRCQVTISVQQASGGHPSDPLNKLIIRGSGEGVQAAMRMIHDIVSTPMQQQQQMHAQMPNQQAYGYTPQQVASVESTRGYTQPPSTAAAYSQPVAVTSAPVVQAAQQSYALGSDGTAGFL